MAASVAMGVGAAAGAQTLVQGEQTYTRAVSQTFQIDSETGQVQVTLADGSVRVLDQGDYLIQDGVLYVNQGGAIGLSDLGVALLFAPLALMGGSVEMDIPTADPVPEVPEPTPTPSPSPILLSVSVAELGFTYSGSGLAVSTIVDSDRFSLVSSSGLDSSRKSFDIADVLDTAKIAAAAEQNDHNVGVTTQVMSVHEDEFGTFALTISGFSNAEYFLNTGVVPTVLANNFANYLNDAGQNTVTSYNGTDTTLFGGNSADTFVAAIDIDGDLDAEYFVYDRASNSWALYDTDAVTVISSTGAQAQAHDLVGLDVAGTAGVASTDIHTIQFVDIEGTDPDDLEMIVTTQDQLIVIDLGLL